ncbi:MAG TPA: SDR family oxidoreductase [Candidatus Dormibacteraeota bacterium]|nr:SDR family oxidoreductase [Candidatus Dormibacteraeota bacterium]
MSTTYEQVQDELRATPRNWLITGVAGFIGSHLLEKLLRLDQEVLGVDNFASGHRKNLAEVQTAVMPAQWSRFQLIEGDIADTELCQRACARASIVLHQAALGSVPASMTDPLAAHRSNVTGCLNVLMAAKQAGAARVVFASSSAVYGDDQQLPKVEAKIGNPLSPYAATKWMDEVYADVFARAFGLQSIGLRYFNVFGPRQDPNGSYAAVIPKWISALLKHEPVYINGDGQTTRDFCHVENVVQANLLAATTSDLEAVNQVYNVALGQRTTLNDLFFTLCEIIHGPEAAREKPIYREFRAGDIAHSLADISKARKHLRFEPTQRLDSGLKLSMDWYRRNIS